MDIKPRQYMFATSVHWQGSGCNGSLAATDRPEMPAISVGCPPEFSGGGDPDRWTPEHLTVAAAETCLMATFTDMALRRKVDLRKYESRARGELTVTDGVFRFARIDIDVELTLGDEDSRNRAEPLIQKAAANCPVSLSMKCPVEVNVTCIPTEF